MSDSVQLFSTHSDAYARFRPTYPDALFAWLAARCARTDRALDLAAGNGQATRPLIAHFNTVFASDASPQQLAAGEHWLSSQRFACQAEQLPLNDGQLDLIVIAQALHWLATERFFAEARRALKPDGLFCAWCYSLLTVDPELDELIERLHGETLAGCWPPGRASVDAGYRDIRLPFHAIDVPAFSIETHWDFSQLIGYLRTWSAVKRWQQIHAQNPIEILEPQLLQCWGDPERQRPVRWPLHFLAGYPGQ